MAKLYLSQETERVIDVSQDAVSSPDVAALRGQQNDSVEVIEDSFKSKTSAQHVHAKESYRHLEDAATKDSSPAVSRATISQRLQKSLSKKGPLFTTRDQRGTLALVSQSMPASQTEKSRLEHPLVTHSPLQDDTGESRRTLTSQKPTKAQHLQARKAMDRFKGLDTDVVPPANEAHLWTIPTEPENRTSTARLKSTTIKASMHGEHITARPQPNSTRSSLAALRARRTREDSSAITPALARESKVSSSRAAAERKDGNRGIDRKSLSDHAVHTSNVSRSVSKATSSSPEEPVSILKKQRLPLQRKSAEQQSIEGHVQVPPQVVNKLKRSAPSASPVKFEASDMYDLPASPRRPGDSRPTKKSRIDPASTSNATIKTPGEKRTTYAAQIAKLDVDAKAKSRRSAAALQPPSTWKQGFSKQPKTAPQDTASCDNQPNVRTRRMAKMETDGVETLTNAVPGNVKASDKPPGYRKRADDRRSASKELASGEAKSSPRHVDSGARQHRDELSNAAVSNGNHVSKADLPVQPNEYPRHRETKSGKVDDTRSNHVENLTSGAQIRGASQHEAILISDQSSSSSIDSESSARKSDRPGEPTLIDAQREAAIVPRTPLHVPSSPPREQHTRSPGSHHNSSIAQRSTIISFGKSGPLNQGQASSKRTALASVSTNRTSMQPATRSSRAKAVAGGATIEHHKRGHYVTDRSNLHKTTPVSTAKVSDSVEDALAGFVMKPKTNRALHTDTFARPTMSNQTKRCADLPTESAEGESFASVDEAKGDQLFNLYPTSEKVILKKVNSQRTESQIAMPPPNTRAPLKPVNAQKSPAVPLTENELKTSTTHGTAASTRDRPAKRRHKYETESARPSKGLKLQLPARISGPRSDPRWIALEPYHVNASKQPSRDVAECFAPAFLQQKPQEPRRVLSHNSQTVDPMGSPIPPNMNVPEDSTVSSAYSQQAHLPSDTIANKRCRNYAFTNTRDEHKTSPLSDLIPSPCQPRMLSSNRKQQPAAPWEKTKVFTGLMTTASNLPSVNGMIALPATDPFQSSQKGSKQRLEEAGSSNFVEKLKEASHQTRKACAQPESNRASFDHRSQNSRDSERSGCGIRTNLDRSSSPSSSETSTETEHSVGPFDDLAIWRNALCPHQMNIFDELVNISHRLVQHLVDRETATTHVIENYIQRGSRIIEKMEADLADERQRLADELQQGKQELRTSLAECEKIVMNSIDAIVRQGAVSMQGATYDSVLEERLKRVLHEYC